MSLFKLENTSNISDDKLEAFINAPWEEDLKSIPGVGPKAEELFKEAEVETPYQLLGKFLILKKKGMKTQEHCDAFYRYLKDIKIVSYRTGIVLCIAEKANVSFPGMFRKEELDLD